MDRKKQLEIWQKNLKQGYRFFQPQHAHHPIPRTMREAEMQKNLLDMLKTSKISLF